MAAERNPNVPFQVQNLIESLLNKKDNVHIRRNYRTRLDEINREISKAIRKYDDELYLSDSKDKNRKRA